MTVCSTRSIYQREYPGGRPFQSLQPQRNAGQDELAPRDGADVGEPLNQDGPVAQ